MNETTTTATASEVRELLSLQARMGAAKTFTAENKLRDRYDAKLLKLMDRGVSAEALANLLHG